MKYFFLLLSFVCLSHFANAEDKGHENHRPSPRVAEPRYKGIPQHGTYHNVVRSGAKPLRAQVLLDRRSHAEITRDPHIVTFSHVGWHPVGHWDHWHRDWGVYWRTNNWSEIQTVTCEAVNTQTEMLFPVTETRAETWVWTGDLVNNVASRALDECVAENGNPEVCVLVERECWNSTYL